MEDVVVRPACPVVFDDLEIDPDPEAIVSRHVLTIARFPFRGGVRGCFVQGKSLIILRRFESAELVTSIYVSSASVDESGVTEPPLYMEDMQCSAKVIGVQDTKIAIGIHTIKEWAHELVVLEYIFEGTTTMRGLIFQALEALGISVCGTGGLSVLQGDHKVRKNGECLLVVEFREFLAEE